MREKNIAEVLIITQYYACSMQDANKEKLIMMLLGKTMKYFPKKNSDYDRWIGFVNSMIKGKKNDHSAHNTFLRHVTKYCDEKNRVRHGEHKKRIINIDNCGGQCECRQIF